MSPNWRIPGPVGVGGTNLHFPRGPIGIQQIVAQATYDSMIQQLAAQATYDLMIQQVEAQATQATYDLLISAWASPRGRTAVTQLVMPSVRTSR